MFCFIFVPAYYPLNIYSAKKVLHNWGLWQFISNTGNTWLPDLYQHLVTSLRNILFEMESKSHEKCLRNKCLMVPGVGNQIMTKWSIFNVVLGQWLCTGLFGELNLKITSRFLCENLHKFNKCTNNYITNCILCMIFFVKKIRFLISPKSHLSCQCYNGKCKAF